MLGTLETLILLATVALLILLRFDARRFGAADYDDEEAPGGWRTWLRRLSWYFFGLALVLVVYFMHPQPLSVLHIQLGEPRSTALLAGLALGAVGILTAIGYAWWRLGDLRLPPAHRYPAGIVNSVATSFLDEAVFRGIVLGLLLAYNWPADLAIVTQALLYALATRLGGVGRPRGLLLLSLAMGLIGGWLTTVTGGIGAAFLGHALTRFAIFISTGHAGQVTPSVAYEQELGEEDRKVTPVGWEVVGDREPGGTRGVQ
jgi:hypothetical protein